MPGSLVTCDNFLYGFEHLRTENETQRHFLQAREIAG
jgi:hypothetical protein